MFFVAVAVVNFPPANSTSKRLFFIVPLWFSWLLELEKAGELKVPFLTNEHRITPSFSKPANG